MVPTLMGKKLPTTSYAVLGLVGRAPVSGYQLAQFASVSIANFWPIAKSQIYGELQRLEELGLVEGSDIRQEKKPDMRQYKLTTDGQAALKNWLDDLTYEQDRVRSGFLVKLFFADQMNPKTLRLHLENYREDAQKAVAHMETIVGMLNPIPEAIYQQATAELGLAHSRAMLEWCDRMLEKLAPSRGAKAPKGRRK